MYEKLSIGNYKFMELDQPFQVLFIFILVRERST